MKRTILAVALSFVIVNVEAAPPSPYNQTFNYNQQYGSTNWYSSPLGMGVAQAGVVLVGGLVNAMSRPDPQVVYVNQNPQAQVVQGQSYPQYQGQAYPQQMQYQNGGYPYGYQAGPPNPYNQQPMYNR
jgi:hypothetical protein